jgi:hypothetical protein
LVLTLVAGAQKNQGKSNTNPNSGGQECPSYSWPVKAWCSSDFFNASSATSLCW